VRKREEKLFIIIINSRFVVLLSGYFGDKIGRRKMIRILTVILFVIPLATQILLQTIDMNIDIK
jgi:MFS family permease